MTVELRLLGQVELLVDGSRVDLGHARRRCVLAALLADANEVVTTDQVVDRVWGEQPPHRARQLVSNYLSHLRQALVAADIAGAVTIERRGGGYVLLTDADQVDVHRFRGLVAQARTTAEASRALDLLGQARALWRGGALADLDTPWAVAVREGLELERFAADAERLDLALRLGRHAEVLPELTLRATTHPLDERVAAQLMLASYRGGRQAEALALYQDVRTRLADELGADPGPELRQLHHRILTADPTLSSATVGATAGSCCPVPRQLPAPPRPFAGRAAELVHLDELSTDKPGEHPSARAGATPRSRTATAGEVVIAAIGGVGGVGKTWLALHWAHRNAHRFPDGQLFVDLRGFSPGNRPLHPVAAVRGFLDAFGVEPDGIPTDLEAQAALYRSVIAGKRVLVVLDNAATTDQVLPLLPGTPTCTVLVTGRTTLSSLIDRYGARHLSLGVLTRDEARTLLARRLGEQRVDAEPGAIGELVELCGYHPLALAIAARHAVTRSRVPLAALAAELRDLGLEAFDHETDPTASLPAVLSWSLRHLTDVQRAVFALLGIAPGPDFDLPAAASLTALPEARTRKVVRALENHSLLDQHPHGRYRMHDVVRAYAATTALSSLSEPVRRAALERVVDFYRHTAHTAENLLNPHRRPIRLDPPAHRTHPHPLPDQPAAMAWLDTHHPHLLAAQHTASAHHRHEAVWHLAWTLTTFHQWRGHHPDALAVWRAAADAATHLPDPAAPVVAHRLLGHTYAESGWHEQAVEHLHHALASAERHHDLAEQAHTHHELARAWEFQEDDRKALEHTHHALRLYRTLGHPVGEARELNTAGWYTARLGDYDTARDHCRAALVLCRLHHHRDGEAATQDSLGYIAHRTGQHRQAVRHYRQALDLYRALGNNAEAARTLDNLGHPHVALGQRARARAAWRQAQELYRQQGRNADAQCVQGRLDSLGESAGPT
ncbi:BTAD domain-containing putative transcriptional regulator [Saccharothrix sp. Mg75]|uniref:AfsR/SARP family transcriptional regulator n=1 Tax=Saccharothrix sp. Mg75 TaxID=3445357 RepID=UPI003EEF40B5